MPNRLAHETSPYLLQHADNPVDWYPWGDEALDRARREQKPILLSIGYAACHWCHVMAHESFADPATAALMNEHFVNIKVDREERPDLDGIYMQAVQAMTGHGGWPMTVFLTPDGAPFYGGTYFPRDDGHAMPSFTRILRTVAQVFRTRPDDVARATSSVRQLYAAAAEQTRSAGALGPALLDAAYHALSNQFDEENGGFDGAPKFPQTMSLDFLLRYWARGGAEQALSIVAKSFRHMARGGIYDQIGGGFARYAVDSRWLVPHFEKMLYDNALLVRLGAHLWQATGDTEIRIVVEDTIAWALREMRAPEGGFVSSLDADSEGGEGQFYLWSLAEFDTLLGDAAPVLRDYWGVVPDGNFEGQTILHVAGDARAVARRHGMSESALQELVRVARTTLYRARSHRVWPGRDDKVLASWNGLMVRALAESARILDGEVLRTAAIESGTFLFDVLVADGRVSRSWKAGRARIAGFLEDYAALGLAAIALYELTFDPQWLDRARALHESVVRWFWDDDVGAFYDTASDQKTLITRPRDVADNATPSGTSLAVELLIRLAELTQDADARRRGTYVLETLTPAMTRYPAAFGHLLGVADLVINGAVEIALIGEPSSRDFLALRRAVALHYVPGLVLAGGTPARDDRIALLAGRPAVTGRATAYVCRNYTCEEPVTEPERLTGQLSHLRSGR